MTSINFMDLGDDIGSDERDDDRPRNAAEIRKAAHVANGGEAVFPCPSCGGSGEWRGRFKTGRCFKCDGKGKVSKAVAAAAKGQATAERNIQGARIDFDAEHPGFIDTLRQFPSSTFLTGLVEKYEQYGRLTVGQVAAARSVIARFEASRNERDAAREKDKAKKSGKVDVSRIEELFARAGTAGLKRPVVSTSEVTVKPAKRFKNVLYVTSNDDVYLGKIEGGQFHARSEASAGTIKQLRMICKNPEKAIKSYAEINGRYDENGVLVEAPCGLCHRMMHTPESLARGIGPDCAANYGID